MFSGKYMEPFGFAHLRIGEGVDVVPTISGRKYKKNLGISKWAHSNFFANILLFF